MSLEQPGESEVSKARPVTQQKSVIAVVFGGLGHKLLKVASHMICLIWAAATIRAGLETEVISNKSNLLRRFHLLVFGQPLSHEFTDGIGVKPDGHMIYVVRITPAAADCVPAKPLVRPVLQQMSGNALHRAAWHDGPVRVLGVQHQTDRRGIVYEPTFWGFEARDKMGPEASLHLRAGILGLEFEFIVQAKIVKHRLQLSRKQAVLAAPHCVLSVEHR